jgi:outer membrane protein assembly factor BamB
MKLAEDKTAIAVTFFLILTMAVTLVATPVANAQNTQKTYAYIGAMPNPVGVGQEVLIHLGITQQLGIVTDGWEGLTVTVTSPDGTTETLGGADGFKTDATGGTGTVYVPTMEGTYKLQTHFPEQSYSGFGPITYLASDSEILELKVQAEPIPIYQSVPLPTEYWTRPINAQFRDWYTISGSWPVPANLFGPSVTPAWLAPYNDGPETAHILWTDAFAMGGLAGGDMGEHAYECGDAYEGKFPSPIIIDGKLYYRAGGSRGLLPVVNKCVDLHTGQELWSKVFLDNRSIAFGQIMYWDGYNQHGVFTYLWVTVGSTWYAFDALTGDWRFTVENVPSGSTMRSPKGELYILQTNIAEGWMGLWNLTALCEGAVVGPDQGSWGNTVHMKTFDAEANTTQARDAWSWNVTIPTSLPGRAYAQYYEDRVIGSQSTLTEIKIWGLSLKPGQEGTVLFNKVWKAPSEWAAGNLTFPGMSGGWVAFGFEDEVGVLGIKETREYYGFSLETGELLWGPTEPQHYLDQFFGDGRLIANGRYISVGIGGIAYCYDVKTGERLWTYEAHDPYNEFLWGNNWWLEPMFVVGDKIYLGHAEHSPVDPKPRGAPFICLNVTTGEEIWRIDGAFRQTHWGGLAIIGDSIIALQNTYDQRVYAIGKGPTAITVTAPDIGVPLGKSVLVRGTVADVSPGTEEYALKARFPNGVPAVADESVNDWMKYVYMQFPIPANATGVEVVLTVLDPNNNEYEVGRATSDDNGFFSCAFTPPVSGKYTIVASFAGSKAYYGSSAETAISVEETPAATAPPTAPPASMADLYLVPGIAGIIIAIAVVGAVLVLMLRKR